MGITGFTISAVIALSILGYIVARARALAGAGGDRRALHSLPTYYGTNAAMFTAVPALGVLAIWLLAQPMMIDNRVSAMIPASVIGDGSNIGLIMSDVRRVSDGLDVAVAQDALTPQDALSLSADTDVRKMLADVGVALGSAVKPEVLAAAQTYRASAQTGRLWMTAVVLALAAIGFVFSVAMSKPDFRARNTVERGVLALLMVAASLAILTTIGIVFSMLFESINFFRLHPWTDFFFWRIMGAELSRGQ